MDIFGKILLTAILVTFSLAFYREWEQFQRTFFAPRTVTVYVTGAVKEQRTVTLPAEARRIHALNLCGGVSSNADLASIDLARPLKDGETIQVSLLPKPRPVVRTETVAEKQKVNLNTATLAELQSLPGIGPVTAKRIIQYRRKSSFTSLEDLSAIRGIRRKTMVRLRPFLELEGL